MSIITSFKHKLKILLFSETGDFGIWKLKFITGEQMNANPETQHKVLILGNQEVGKTAIVNSVSFIQTFEIKGKPRNNTQQ